MTRRPIEKCIALAENSQDKDKAEYYINLAIKSESRLYEICQACDTSACPGQRCDLLED